jgi:hypothetical protein
VLLQVAKSQPLKNGLAHVSRDSVEVHATKCVVTVPETAVDTASAHRDDVVVISDLLVKTVLMSAQSCHAPIIVLEGVIVNKSTQPPAYGVVCVSVVTQVWIVRESRHTVPVTAPAGVLVVVMAHALASQVIPGLLVKQ